MPGVLIVEDEPPIAEPVAVNLRHNGFQPTWAMDSRNRPTRVGRSVAGRHPAGLECCLAKSGLALAKKWRKDPRTKAVPILMLTARGDESDRVAGWTPGQTTTSMTFSTKEMLARIRAVLRRRSPEMAGGVVAIGALVLDASTHRVTYDSQPLAKVGPTEFKLLHYFMQNSERVHSRGQLLDKFGVTTSLSKSAYGGRACQTPA